jgi:hypothetical protein
MLAFVLGLVANLLTKPIERWLDARIRSRVDRHTRDTQYDYEEAKRYREHPEDFYAYLLRLVASFMRWLALLIVSTVFLVGFGLALLNLPKTGFSQAMSMVGLFLVTFSSGVVSIIFTRLVRRAQDRAFMMHRVYRHGSPEESASEGTSEP